MENLKDLRAEIQAIHPKRSRRRYPSDLQARIVEYYQQQALKKQSMSDVAQALDIATSTLHRFVWKTKKDPDPDPDPAALSLRPVRVVDPPYEGQADFSPSQAVLHIGSEISVSGLAVDELVSVLRALR